MLKCDQGGRNRADLPVGDGHKRLHGEFSRVRLGIHFCSQAGEVGVFQSLEMTPEGGSGREDSPVAAGSLAVKSLVVDCQGARL